MSKAIENEQWTNIIKPQSKFFNLNLKEMLQYKFLLYLFVRRDFVAYYKQTILGPLWYIIQPLMTTIIFTVIFGNIAKISTDGVPHIVFYMAGTILWSYFSLCITKTSSTFIANSSLFGKVYFPRLVMPVSIIISNLMSFIIQFFMFFGFVIFYFIIGSKIKPNIFILISPLLILQISLLSFGFGLLISALTTKYRDLQFLVSFGLQLWMFVTPIVYPLSEIPAKWKIFFIINPMTSIVENFRYAFLGAGQVSLFYNIISIASTVLILFSGLLIFTRVERTFMDKV